MIVVTGSSAQAVGGGLGRVLRPIPSLFARAFRGLFADPTEGAPAPSEVAAPAAPPPEPDPEPAAEAAPPPETPAAEKPRRRAEAVDEAEQQSLSLPPDSGRWNPVSYTHLTLPTICSV